MDVCDKVIVLYTTNAVVTMVTWDMVFCAPQDTLSTHIQTLRHFDTAVFLPTLPLSNLGYKFAEVKQPI